MSTPKNHHYIPQMLLKRFANQEGKLYVYDKDHPDKGVQKKDPRKTFVRRHFYSQEEEDGTRDVSVETQFLAPLESDASLVIEKIVNAARQGQTPGLSSDEKDIWVKFSYNQFVRVPEMRETYKEKIFQEIRSELDFIGRFRPFTDSELSILDDEETMERLWRNSTIQSVRMTHAKEVFDILSEKRIGVAVIRNPKPKRNFVIGSNPVVKLSHPGRSHLSDPTVEVWLPLARDVAVTPCPGERDKVVSANDRHIRAINRSIFEQSTVIAGCSRELIESLLGKEARTVLATTET
ncbi:MAG: DUF4238 domain-containing protein [Caldilineaceae bacterium]|nr:DUF4238 domain-containing protein [Caldilineaceae bacterium]